MIYGVAQLAYLIASACFIFALHWMNTPATARKGVYAGIAGPLLAVLATWAEPTVVHHAWIVLAIAAGFAVGVPLSRVPLTAVPQRTALSHAFGGLAAGLVGTAEYYLQVSESPANLTTFRMVAPTKSSTIWSASHVRARSRCRSKAKRAGRSERLHSTTNEIQLRFRMKIARSFC